MRIKKEREDNEIIFIAYDKYDANSACKKTLVYITVHPGHNLAA